ncbi:MAG: cellulase family glycosylhydrolase [Candidatus Magasanikbacteria bacterium]|uniref:GH10 domain-containing protein n=1 Tax=Candidatus Magasanikbacteria bacterium CG10_big_fil_rev_8_21_14_0_10_38_6 TaxID=1974647 RepID=A0A2M6P1N4_9BACT|nr:cellulase family glycosylhydrolase [Candidatus Magasanikbacteria bacterium]NCS72101.1 cellulase family glycosylhydrolase [Candidatus Magasanikbacteria bacterium]PIR77611.1 MAG: hypothetical protein COU30_01515 [Candidatus Magasanikbacteria bacterium CG10_big_fil_rev_8_21_14_0_10_38_6]
MKILKRILLFFGITVIILYAVLWIVSQKTYSVEFGISFNQNHAESLGLDWKKVYTDMLEELSPKYIRIAAMWSQIEAVKTEFNFDDVDFMMEKAKEHGTKVVLVVGQKAPRWPECHVPGWLDYSQEESRNHLSTYITKVVERYKDNEALEMWQVENEPYIRFVFGECTGYDKEFVADEIALVKKLDPQHKIMITDSGELASWHQASKAGDVFGTTLYRIVKTPKGHIFTYDFLPPAFYRWKAFFWGVELQDFFIAELQAEPWFSDSTPMDTPIVEQEQTMNPERLKQHLLYAQKIGSPRAYLWGVEWWYYMNQAHNDNRYWNIVKEAIQ